MSGLRSSFSMPRRMRKTIDAIVNVGIRGIDSPVAETTFATPEVRANVAGDGMLPHRDFHARQVRSGSTAASVGTADSLAFEGGGSISMAFKMSRRTF